MEISPISLVSLSTSISGELALFLKKRIRNTIKIIITIPSIITIIIINVLLFLLSMSLPFLFSSKITLIGWNSYEIDFSFK